VKDTMQSIEYEICVQLYEDKGSGVWGGGGGHIWFGSHVGIKPGPHALVAFSMPSHQH
jgi:hypothetical protein